MLCLWKGEGHLSIHLLSQNGLHASNLSPLAGGKRRKCGRYATAVELITPFSLKRGDASLFLPLRFPFMRYGAAGFPFCPLARDKTAHGFPPRGNRFQRPLTQGCFARWSRKKRGGSQAGCFGKTSIIPCRNVNIVSGRTTPFGRCGFLRHAAEKLSKRSEYPHLPPDVKLRR